jgi:hypothetical protein
MTIIAVIALTSGLAALTATAVFVFFGAYWRMEWRQRISILWSIGIVLLVIGVAFMVLGALGHAVGGRSHYY